MREEQQELWDDYKAWLLEHAKDKVSLVTEACQVFRDRLVLKIPAKAFAAYDAASVLRMIQSEREHLQHTAEERAVAKALGEIKSEESILSVVVMPFKGQTRIAYRIYEKGVPVSNELVIKGRLRVAEDVQDIMDIDEGYDYQVCFI